MDTHVAGWIDLCEGAIKCSWNRIRTADTTIREDGDKIRISPFFNRKFSFHLLLSSPSQFLRHPIR